MNLFAKQKQAHRNRNHTYDYRRGKGGGGINQEYRINKYTLPYIKQINNKDLLYSTGNYIQYLIITYNGKELRKRIYIHTHKTESFCCTPETKQYLPIVNQLYFNKEKG